MAKGTCLRRLDAPCTHLHPPTPRHVTPRCAPLCPAALCLQALDFSGLGAAATTQLDKAKRLAAEYAAAALRSRPKLALSLCLDAPKVAVPVADGQGESSLV